MRQLGAAACICCTKVKYLDLGHNEVISDISFVKSMPELEVFIIAMNPVSDLTPLASCPKLEYLELNTTAVADLSPLANATALRHLNISDNWNASANVDITRFKASQPGPENAPLIDADQDITRGTSALFIENNYKKTSGAVSFFYSWGDHWINDGYNEGAAPKLFRFVSYDEMLGASAWQSLNLFEGNRLTLGFDYYRYGGKANNHFVDGPQAGDDVLQVDASEDEIAGYAEMRQMIGDWITLNAGLRVDHHSKAGTELVPQAGAAFHLPANAEVRRYR